MSSDVTLRLIGDPGEEGHRGHDLLIRRYPALSAPAVFVDCFTCSVTWEQGVPQAEAA
jgi:hypothetical protein